MTDTQTKILIVEHDRSDIDLIQRELKKGDFNFVAEVVANEHDYTHALQSFKPNIILSDYSLPSFSGPEAFAIKQNLAPNTPFVFVSGTIGEENSIELIKNGVTDYALKDKLFTLNTKIKRALKESKEKQQKIKTEIELINSERRLARAATGAHGQLGV
jgi:two-component system, NarL family, sensor histidine kinase UhpB